jgi:hypothetical protein
MDSHHQQVFLGGACGRTTWRRQIAIPALEAAGVTYYDPQLEFGKWTPAREPDELRAKEAADVLLFMIGRETRGVASIGEVAYYLGSGRRLAVAVADIGDADAIDGRVPSPEERDDLNRGRIFIRTMARLHGVPVFADAQGAVQYAISLVQSGCAGLSVERLYAILSDIRFKDGDFIFEETPGGFLIQLRCQEVDVATGTLQTYYGRKWHVATTADESEVVRTAFKAAITWQEHEAREGFTYRGAPVFGPHADVDHMARLHAVKSRPER